MWLTKRIFEFLALFSALFLAFLTKNVKCDHEGSSDPLDWLRDAVPGEPGVDYPIFSEVGDSSFSCADRVFGGYYADPELQCQGYHVCLTPPNAPIDRKTSFLCPNGTIFNQQLLICDWWFNVDCEESEDFYAINEKIGSDEPLSTDEGSLSTGNQLASQNGQNSDPIIRQKTANTQQRPQRKRKQKPKVMKKVRKGQRRPKPVQRQQTPGVSSSSILPSELGGETQGSRSQEPQFDIVQYDATIPDDDSGDIPILLADPFRDLNVEDYDNEQDQQAVPISTLYGAPIG